MTREEIDKIASDYLNDSESELDMLEVFVIAKESLEQETLVDKIRTEIEQELYDIFDDSELHLGERYAFERVIEIIDKYKDMLKGGKE